MFSLFRLCRKDEVSFDIVAKTGNTVAETGHIVTKNGNNVEATFDVVERTNLAIISFDIVAVFLPTKSNVVLILLLA